MKINFMLMKRLLSLIIATILLSLTSCSFLPSLVSRTDLLNEIDKSDREIAEDILLEILDALENKDSEALKNMLSEEALSEAEDIDEDIGYVLEYYKGNHIDYKGDTPTSSGKYNNGKCTEYKFSSTFEVITEVDTYMIAVSGRTICDDNPKQVGLHCVQIIKASENRFFPAYGIYVASEKRRKQENSE